MHLSIGTPIPSSVGSPPIYSRYTNIYSSLTAKTIKFTYINKLSSWLCHRHPHTMKKYGGYTESDSGLSDKTSPMWGDHHSLAGPLLFMWTGIKER